MFLKEYFNEEQCELCKEAGVIVENRKYSADELYGMEKTILDYINDNCINEDFYEKEQKYDELLDIIMDLENEEDETNPFAVEINENDHVELSNGKTGYVIDITNSVYTVEVDEKYKTGNIDDDIMIVASNSILGII